VKYVWLSLRKIIFNSVKFYSWYCKIFRGLTFFLDTVYMYLFLLLY